MPATALAPPLVERKSGPPRPPRRGDRTGQPHQSGASPQLNRRSGAGMSPNGHVGRRAAQNPPTSPYDELPRISLRPGHFSGTSTRAADGAGDGNRTHVSSLGSCSSTIELHLRRLIVVISSRSAQG